MASATDENRISSCYVKFFTTYAEYLLLATEIHDTVSKTDIMQVELSYLKEVNEKIYSEILPDNYGNSYANPEFAVSSFGTVTGQILSMLAYEIRNTVYFGLEKKIFPLLIRMEIFLEVYGFFEDLGNKDISEKNDEGISGEEQLRQIIYWFVSDYFETETSMRVSEMVNPKEDFAARIIMESDFSNPEYLYRYGEYVSEDEIRFASFVNSLSEEKKQKIADTFTEGYRIGFITTGKNLSIKNTVNIRYPIGMEPVIKLAIKNFAAMGLEPVIYRAYGSIFRGQHTARNGFFGGFANQQYGHDHSKDLGIFLDGQMVTRRIECLKASFEEYKELACGHAGPAVMEIFGEEPFVPVKKNACVRYSEKQQEMLVRFASSSGEITNQYIKGEERSFTIIAFPSPQIGKDFEEIFAETLEINTLDYYLYQKLQQTIIDALDKADKVHITGRGDNKTDIVINLIKTENPEKQTKFENCVADVNIPVGEVFTSPVLKGTNGILCVSQVYLNELKYINLKVELEDGMVKDYSCDNYEDLAKGKEFFKDNVLFNHETLPIGEFAIGTNTRAYAMGIKYDIQGKLPILIAEKTGPHFALGDTCYSHAEDVAVFNPDGKEIVARDNEVSILRKTNPEKAYFNCHTDITLPYDEIGVIEAVYLNADGEEVREKIIENGRFVLDGLQELNRYLDGII